MSKQVFARIGFSDVIVPVEKMEEKVVGTDTFLVGYELEDGTECNEDGIPLEEL